MISSPGAVNSGAAVNATVPGLSTVLLAQPRGFCAGVTRAIDIVERALRIHGAPVYVFHEIVHNGHVVQDLRSRGAVFVNALDQVPAGATTVFSAHGVAAAVERQAQARGLNTIDATCPLVAKVHVQAQRYARMGHHIVVIGHAGHEEVVGTVGQVDAPVHVVGTADDVAALPFADDASVAYVTQTTLSVDDTRQVIASLQRRFHHLIGPDITDICYATQNRQQSLRGLAQTTQLVLVVGASNSSNSQRLREVALQQGLPAHLVQDDSGINSAWLAGVQRVGVTAGASTPEVLVQRVVQRLQSLGAQVVQEMPGPDERVVFKLPLAVLRRAA